MGWNKLFLLVLLVISGLASCFNNQDENKSMFDKNEESKHEDKVPCIDLDNVKSLENILLTQEDILKYYIVNSNDSLHKKYQFSNVIDTHKIKEFKLSDSLLQAKENDDYKSIIIGQKYYPIDTFKYGNFNYQMILYITENSYGIPNEEIYLQLNSYDENCKLIDAILLNEAWRNEGRKGYRNFIIEKEMITITKIIEDWNIYDENEELTGKRKSKPDIDSTTVVYKIDKGPGMFVKIE